MQDLPRQPPQLTECLSLDETIQLKQGVVNQMANSIQHIPYGKVRDRMINTLFAEASNLKWLIYLKTLLAQLDLNHQIHNN